jgi:hypothetical protein
MPAIQRSLDNRDLAVTHRQAAVDQVDAAQQRAVEDRHRPGGIHGIPARLKAKLMRERKTLIAGQKHLPFGKIARRNVSPGSCLNVANQL